MTIACVVIEHDQDPDFSWLEDDCHGEPGCDYRDPANHVALEMTAYDDEGEMIDNLCGIDFLAAEDNWRTGTFWRVSQIPEAYDYLRELAREMGLEG